ncbi:MAG: hypothetical protein RLO81_09405 [Fulvivirga sp.]|uniref:hypothetical protein n=1 Tax=Fulvivirga sp. TaxID=1931237 RepID=UPI0032ECA5DB
MGKNILITVLVLISTISTTFFIYANLKVTEAERMAEEQQLIALKAQEEARKQQEYAAQALAEAESQRQKLEEALSKCK